MIKYLDDAGIKYLVEKLDERHVNTSGDQTISGNKVFTGTTSTMTLHTYNPLFVNNGTDNSKNTSLYTDIDGVFKIVNSSSSVERPTYNGKEMALMSDINKKVDDYSIELYNGVPGNPNPVRFATVDYSTCNSEEGVSAKISMVSGHGNGVSYVFLQDVIINVSFDGTVTVDNFKYYGESVSYDGLALQYGDIFWVADRTNKLVDLYCLMGQFARVNMTPWKRLTYSSKGSITQYTSATSYSSGTKDWANNSEIALASEVQEKCINNDILYVGGDTPLIGLNDDRVVEVGSLDNNLILNTVTTRPQWTTDGETFKDLAIVDDIDNYLPLTGGTLTKNNGTIGLYPDSNDGTISEPSIEITNDIGDYAGISPASVDLQYGNQAVYISAEEAYLEISTSNDYYVDLFPNRIEANGAELTFPTKSGTLALTNDLKLELKSEIQRIGEFRYLIISIPYSDELLNEINNGKVNLELYKQSNKKEHSGRNVDRNAYNKWVCPLKDFGAGSSSFGDSFNPLESGFSVNLVMGTIPPSITVGGESNLLEVTHTATYIKLTYNLSALALAMTYYRVDDTINHAEWKGGRYTDTSINGNQVVGRRMSYNNGVGGRVALRYKFRLFFETTQKYSEFTDTITILYTKPNSGSYMDVGMQIN